jgi:MFS family permease
MTRSATPAGANGNARFDNSTWADLLSGRNLAILTVLASGVLLYAMNLYFTAALMPSIVADIGGQHYYAWVTTSFVVAAIVASLLAWNY